MVSEGENKVLFITYEFPPMGGIGSLWVTKYIKYLPAFGWDPVVITARDAPTNIPDKSLSGELPEGMQIYRSFSLEPTRLVRALRRLRGLWKPGEEESRGEAARGESIYSYTLLPLRLLTKLKAFLVPDEKIGWFPFALRDALRAVDKHHPRVIYSTAPPFTAHLVALACKRITALPWVCEFKDPWLDNPHHKPYNRFTGRAFMFLEKVMLEKADSVVCAMPAIVEGFQARYGAETAKRCHVINYGFDEDDFSGEVALADRFSITWAGKVYGELYPWGLLEAIRSLIEDGSVDAGEIEFNLTGTMDVESHEKLARSDLEGVVNIEGFMDHEHCVRRMRSSHLLTLQLNEGAASEMLYTAKMFEYFGARRPILALAGEGDTTRLIESLNAGIVVEPDDVEGIRQAIMHYYGLYKAGEDFYVYNPDIPRLYNREKQTRKLAEIFKRVT